MGIAVRCTGRFSYSYLRSCDTQLKSLTLAPFLYPELLGRHQRLQLCVVSIDIVSMLSATATILDTYSYSASEIILYKKQFRYTNCLCLRSFSMSDVQRLHVQI